MLLQTLRMDNEICHITTILSIFFSFKKTGQCNTRLYRESEYHLITHFELKAKWLEMLDVAEHRRRKIGFNNFYSYIIFSGR